MLDTIAMPLAADSGADSIVCGLFLATPEVEIARPEARASRHGAAEAAATEQEERISEEQEERETLDRSSESSPLQSFPYSVFNRFLYCKNKSNDL